MKIALVSFAFWPPDFGGELLITIESLQALAERGHQILALTSGHPGFPNRENRNGIEIIRSPIIHSSRLGRIFRRLGFSIWANLWLKKNDFDILHICRSGGVDLLTNAFGMWLVIRAARNKHKKVVTVHSLATSDNDLFSLDGFAGRLRKLYLDNVDNIISVSPALNQAVAKYYPQKAVQITFGIRDRLVSNLSKEERTRLRENLGLLENDVIFVFLASITKRKGFDILASAFSELADLHSNWKLWIIGPRTKTENQNIKGSEVDELTKPLASLQRQIHFWGRINDHDELAKMLAVSDVFVFPSRREGFGLAPAEAMAAGIPVIISKIPGVTDLVSIEGQTGLYITPGNALELKNAMEKLGADKELRDKMGQSARQRIQSEFDWKTYIRRLEEIYGTGMVRVKNSITKNL